MEYSFQVENIRCSGCATTIAKKLSKIDGVKDIQVNVENKQVIVIVDPSTNVNLRTALSEKLIKLGYPEVGTTSTNKLKTKAASVVSCAIGKISNKS